MAAHQPRKVLTCNQMRDVKCIWKLHPIPEGDALKRWECSYRWLLWLCSMGEEKEASSLGVRPPGGRERAAQFSHTPTIQPITFTKATNEPKRVYLWQSASVIMETWQQRKCSSIEDRLNRSGHIHAMASGQSLRMVTSQLSPKFSKSMMGLTGRSLCLQPASVKAGSILPFLWSEHSLKILFIFKKLENHTLVECLLICI